MRIQEPTILRDVVFGHGGIDWSAGQARTRPLKMDVYVPANAACSLRPGLVMAFGGAFHRGSKEDDSFESEAGNTAVAAYCLHFARQGYVCFSIDYRLVQEDPDPGITRVVHAPEAIPTSRVEVVRRLLNLPPATPVQLWRGIEAASDDMATAIGFIQANAKQWGLDATRLAAGGFSAGARTALNAAFGEKASVAAVVSLSGYMDPDDLALHLPACRPAPAVLLVHAQNDLDYVVRGTPHLAGVLRRAGVHCQTVEVEGSGHFYKAQSPGWHDVRGRTTVEQAISLFLQEHL